MNKQDLQSIIGFLLFMLGFVSILLTVVGVQFVFLRFLDTWDSRISILVKLTMIILGIILVYQAKYRPRD
ncbi:MAG TPA: hypothetical protein PK076_09930 [Saprospiraceae bacterium]|nr:hypothetical protein [Saprospiraceae bacterium]HQW56436.1 hypothetical protein [Saprospiraceae bacterium]